MSQAYEQWYDPQNPIVQKIMSPVSPALNADKIIKPLFVIQGANNPRVNIKGSEQMVLSLIKKELKCLIW